MTTYRYPQNSLLPDYARAAGGFLLMAGPLPWLLDTLPVVVIMGALALVFALFGASTAIRQLTAVTLHEEGVSTSGPRAATVLWRDMDRVDMRYFSTRKDREKGWMELRLMAGKKAVKVDSALDGFVEIARAAADAAAERGLELSPTTRENFLAIGIQPPRAAAAVLDAG